MVLAITGITAFLLLLEVSIPPLRGYPILETDREQQTGETVKLIKALIRSNCMLLIKVERINKTSCPIPWLIQTKSRPFNPYQLFIRCMMNLLVDTAIIIVAKCVTLVVQGLNYTYSYIIITLLLRLLESEKSTM